MPLLTWLSTFTTGSGSSGTFGCCWREGGPCQGAGKVLGRDRRGQRRTQLVAPKELAKSRDKTTQ